MNSKNPKTRIQQKNTSAILEAALDVFSQYGYRGSTLDLIAKTAGMSKPNLLYYFASKEAIHTTLLEGLLETWLDPLHKLNSEGNPRDEILAYVHRKLQMSRDFPRQSRLFANEILQGAPRIGRAIEGELKTLVDEKSVVIEGWIAEKKIAPVDPRHLLFSIWSLTQHYADFDVQVRMILGEERPDPYPDAEAFLDSIFTRILAPIQE